MRADILGSLVRKYRQQGAKVCGIWGDMFVGAVCAGVCWGNVCGAFLWMH